MPSAVLSTKHQFYTHTYKNWNFQNPASIYDFLGGMSPSSLLNPSNVAGSQASMSAFGTPILPVQGFPQPGTTQGQGNVQILWHPNLKDLLQVVAPTINPLAVTEIKILWDVIIICQYKVENTSAHVGTIAFAAHNANLGMFLPAGAWGVCPLNGNIPASGTISLAATDGVADFAGASGATVTKILSLASVPPSGGSGGLGFEEADPGGRLVAYAEGSYPQPPSGSLAWWFGSSGPGTTMHCVPTFTVADPAITYGGALVAGDVTIEKLYRCNGTFEIKMRYSY